MKIEFDVPNFEKELSISIVIRKDGEVVCNTATPPKTDVAEEKEKPAKTKKAGGNMMDADF
jgi:hypothetical protein